MPSGTNRISWSIAESFDISGGTVNTISEGVLSFISRKYFDFFACCLFVVYSALSG
jgi:hypothetical protein